MFGFGWEVRHILLSSLRLFRSLPHEASPLFLSVASAPSTSHNTDGERKESIGAVPTAEKRKLIVVVIFYSCCVLRRLPSGRPLFAIHEWIS